MNTKNLIINGKVLGFIIDSKFLVEVADEWLVSWVVIFLISLREVRLFPTQYGGDLVMLVTIT